MTEAARSGPRVAVVHGTPLEQPGFAERTLCWVRGEMLALGASVDLLLPTREGPSPARLRDYDSIVVGDLGGVYGELAWISALAALKTRVLVMSHGHPFCVDGSRLCGRCPIRFACPTSDRVEVYRRLAQRATHLVYHSPLHQQVSEAFLGAYPDKTSLVGPVAPPLLSSRTPDLQRVAFARSYDPAEWTALSEVACREPTRELLVYGLLPPEFEAPPNMRVVAPVPLEARCEELARALELVCVPSRPLPFGEDAAAMIGAGRRVTLNANVGLRSYDADLTDRAQLAELVQNSQRTLRSILRFDGAISDAAPRPAPTTWLTHGRRVFVWAHQLGLGDSVNLLPFVQALEDNVGAQGVRSAFPDAHAELLRETLRSTVLDDSELNLQAERTSADLIIEVTIYRRDAYAEDIRDERWLQIELARQPLLYGAVHENLLSALHRAGLTVEPRRPQLTHSVAAKARAKQRIETAGVDLSRDLLLACHPGAGGAHKRWPVERFAALVKRAAATLGAKILLITGPKEDLLALPFWGHVLHSRAEALVEVAALMACCHGFVGNDSGLMHVACAAGTPALSLFGPSIHHLWGPSHPDSVVVAARDEEGQRRPDLLLISEDEAFEGLTQLARRVATRTPSSTDTLLVGSPRLEVQTVEQSRSYTTPLGQVAVTTHGKDDPVRDLLSRLPADKQALAAAQVDAELLDTLLAAGVLMPSWATRGAVTDALYGT